MSQSAPDKLMGCPFCGAQPEYKFLPEADIGEWDTHSFSCWVENNHIIRVIALTKNQAETLWNTRNG